MKLEFPEELRGGGGRCQTKKTLHKRGMDIFWNTRIKKYFNAENDSPIMRKHIKHSRLCLTTFPNTSNPCYGLYFQLSWKCGQTQSFLFEILITSSISSHK